MYCNLTTIIFPWHLIIITFACQFNHYHFWMTILPLLFLLRTILCGISTNIDIIIDDGRSKLHQFIICMWDFSQFIYLSIYLFILNYGGEGPYILWDIPTNGNLVFWSWLFMTTHLCKFLPRLILILIVVVKDHVYYVRF